MSRAACRAHPELPWVNDRDQVTTTDSLEMAAVCARCPVTKACAAFAARTRVKAGFWAGRHRDPDDSAVGGAA